jgi:hypothetical protein
MALSHGELDVSSSSDDDEDDESKNDSNNDKDNLDEDNDNDDDQQVKEYQEQKGFAGGGQVVQCASKRASSFCRWCSLVLWQLPKEQRAPPTTRPNRTEPRGCRVEEQGSVCCWIMCVEFLVVFWHVFDRAIAATQQLLLLS